MSWTQATFTNRSGKHQQVWVQTDDDGKLVLDSGRAQMKYANDEDAKVYSAAPANVAIGDAAPTTRGTKPSKPKAKKTSVAVDDSIWKTPAGAKVIESGAPAHLASEKMPAEGVIEAWTDGACTGNPGPSGYGVVLRYNGEHTEISQFIGLGTNNIAELLAIGIALEQTKDVPGELQVHTDSTYSIGVLSKGWKAKANVELIAWIKQLASGRKVKYVKVKGHAGIPLNERADTLAVAAVERSS